MVAEPLVGRLRSVVVVQVVVLAARGGVTRRFVRGVYMIRTGTGIYITYIIIFSTR